MIFRYLIAACIVSLFAGCAVPMGQIRNGRFVSQGNGTVRIQNKIIFFDLTDLPPGSQVKRKVFYRLRPDHQIDLNLYLASDFREGVGAYLWTLDGNEIHASGRLDPSSSAVFFRPSKR